MHERKTLEGNLLDCVGEEIW